SSATNGSSIVSVDVKKRSPARPWAAALATWHDARIVGTTIAAAATLRRLIRFNSLPRATLAKPEGLGSDSGHDRPLESQLLAHIPHPGRHVAAVPRWLRDATDQSSFDLL